MPLIGTGTGSSIGSQDVFEGLQGYSLKREYFGESFNYRNVETFTLDIYVTDLTNIGVDADGRNYLSNYINTEISNMLGIDKSDINIKNIEVPNSSDGKENLITIGTYKVTVEVRQKIEDDVMWKGYCEGAVGATPVICATAGGTWISPQHEELDPATASFDKFKNLQKVFENHGNYIDGLTENIEIERGEDGSRTISHSVNMEARKNDNTGDDAKTVAQNVAYDLLSSMNFTNAWGINFFTTAAKDFGFVNKFLSQKNNRFTESYDLLTNKFSFTRKTKAFATKSTNKHTKSAKYSIQISESGEVSITEDLEITSMTSDLRSVKKQIDGLSNDSLKRCRQVLLDYDYTPNATYPDIGASSNPTSLGDMNNGFDNALRTASGVSIDERARRATINTTWNFASDHDGYSTKDWTVVLEKDAKGISTLDYSLDMKLISSDSLRKGRNIDAKDLDKARAGKQDPISELIAYDEATPANLSSFYDDLTDTFWQNNPNLLDFFLDGEIVNWGDSNKGLNTNPTEWTLLTKTASSTTRGKTYSLKKKWTDDPIYIKSLPGCIDCFKKIEPKIVDNYPQNNFTENVVVNRDERWDKKGFA